jgi:hypothetical protein
VDLSSTESIEATRRKMLESSAQEDASSFIDERRSSVIHEECRVASGSREGGSCLATTFDINPGRPVGRAFPQVFEGGAYSFFGKFFCGHRGKLPGISRPKKALYISGYLTRW